MLTSVVLRNFKSFMDERAQLSSFTLLVGANGSGKSNFLDALRLVHGLAHGWSLWDVANGRTEGATRLWDGVRGGSRELIRHGATRASLETNWSIESDNYRHTFDTDGTRLLSEMVDNLASSERIADSRLRLEFLPGSGAAGVEELSAERSVTSFARGHWLRALQFTLAGIRFVDPQPGAMRSYPPKPPASPVLPPSSTGDNLSAVLWQLCQDDPYREELADWLVEFCGPEIRSLDFDVTDSGDVLLRIVDAEGAKISARSMSDGTLRFLYLLAQLKTLWADAPLIVEDLEHGFHPGRCRLLVDAIASATKPRHPLTGDGCSVIATTHSAEVVEAALRVPHATVLLFVRDAQGRGTLVRDVRSLPQFDEVLQRRDFGYLLNTGWLERAV
jgi:predicted ATPase